MITFNGRLQVRLHH